MIERANGGWLAVSPEGCSVKIGVTANSRDEAAIAFSVAIEQWLGILDVRAESNKDALVNV